MSDVGPKEIKIVTDNIGRTWKELGRKMEIPETDIENFEVDFQSYGVKEMAYKMLQKWQRETEDTSVAKLQICLKEVGRLDICKLINAERSKRPSESSETMQGAEIPPEKRNISPKQKNYVCMNIGDNWRAFVEQLGFQPGRIDSIQSESKGLAETCRKAMDEWMQHATPKLSDLIEALKETNHNALAQTIIAMK